MRQEEVVFADDGIGWRIKQLVLASGVHVPTLGRELGIGSECREVLELVFSGEEKLATDDLKHLTAQCDDALGRRTSSSLEFLRGSQHFDGSARGSGEQLRGPHIFHVLGDRKKGQRLAALLELSKGTTPSFTNHIAVFQQVVGDQVQEISRMKSKEIGEIFEGGTPLSIPACKQIIHLLGVQFALNVRKGRRQEVEVENEWWGEEGLLDFNKKSVRQSSRRKTRVTSHQPVSRAPSVTWRRENDNDVPAVPISLEAERLQGVLDMYGGQELRDAFTKVRQFIWEASPKDRSLAFRVLNADAIEVRKKKK